MSINETRHSQLLNFALGLDCPQFSGHEVREDEDGTWWTSFPPPAGFDGEEQGEFGDEDYKRILSAREQAVLDAEYDRDDAEYRAREDQRRGSLLRLRRGRSFLSKGS